MNTELSKKQYLLEYFIDSLNESGFRVHGYVGVLHIGLKKSTITWGDKNMVIHFDKGKFRRKRDSKVSKENLDTVNLRLEEFFKSDEWHSILINVMSSTWVFRE